MSDPFEHPAFFDRLGGFESEFLPTPSALPRVLIIDDDVNLLHGMRRLLHGRYAITVLSSPSEALELLGRDRGFAVILSDFHMPDMTGAEFFGAALRLAPDAVRVLLTGSSSPSAAVNAINVGHVFRVVSKPIRPDELRATLDAACDEFVSAVRDRSELRETRKLRHADADLTAARRLDIEGALAGQIRTVFQPIIELGGNGVVGHEALSRFPGDPDRTPDRLFDEAAALGMGVDLNVAAVRIALETWRACAPHGQALWVNLSPATILSGAAHDTLLRAQHRLVLEITERSPVDDYDRLRDALRPLRQHGVSLAIDDVGAGYSSLLHVTELRPDIMKLDRSIIADFNDDQHRQALVSSLISFAKMSGITPLGEGVESAAEASALRELGAVLAQGYHFGRPDPTPLRSPAALPHAAPNARAKGAPNAVATAAPNARRIVSAGPRSGRKCR